MARRRKPVDEQGVPFEQPFPGYEVNARLGADAETVTWRAWDLRLDREVWIVELTPDLEACEAPEDVVEEFFNTARTAARLKHPHLVRAVDTGRSGERFFLVTETVPGESLVARLTRGGPAGEPTVLAVAEQTGRLLDYLYELGIVHGDIRPGTLYLDETETVRLAGLGLPLGVLYASPAARARHLPAYAAPEQFDEDAVPDARSDLYALGSVLYHLLTGRPPFPGEDAEAVIRRKLQEEPASPRSIDPTLPAATAGVVMSLLATDPPARPADPAEFLERLGEHPVLHARRNAEAAARREAEEHAARAAAESEEPEEETDELDEELDAVLARSRNPLQNLGELVGEE